MPPYHPLLCSYVVTPHIHSIPSLPYPPLYPTRYPCSLIAELCEQGSLQELLLRHVQRGTYIPWADGVRYVSGIAAAMCYLHLRKPLAVMHRDLKPANCLIVREEGGGGGSP